MKKKCKVCNNLLYDNPILLFNNMPKAAQYFPNKKELIKDKGVALKIFQCSGCGLIQLINTPVHYHKEVVRAAAYSPEMKKFRERQFLNFCETYHLKNKKVIEIGCGCGEYMNLMRLTGADIYGIEYAPKSVSTCNQKGLNVVKDYPENGNQILKDSPFQAFYILNFLEHFPDPNSALRCIYNNLSDEGIGLVEVPNFDIMIKENVFSEFISDHLMYFTTETLNFILNKNGFEVLVSNHIWHDYIISSVVRKKNKIDLSSFYQSQKQITEEINNFIDKFNTNSVVIWGAGHQALAMITLTNIAKKISCVIDSATFKQNKFTPATHIPIVSPEILKQESIKAVIVMAASYSDEVASLIRNKYDNNIKIAILRTKGLEYLK